MACCINVVKMKKHHSLVQIWVLTSTFYIIFFQSDVVWDAVANL